MEMKEGSWAREEDEKLLGCYIEEDVNRSWSALLAKGLQNCGTKSKMMWTDNSGPNTKRGKLILQEDSNIIQPQALLGNRWTGARKYEMTDQWKKRLTTMTVNPMTHKQYINNEGSIQTKYAVNLSHMAQWESARLEAEARLVRESKRGTYNPLNLHQLNRSTGVPPPPPVPAPCLDVLNVWLGACTSTYHTETNTIFNSFFNSARNLESPASTLNYIEKFSPGSVWTTGTEILNQYTEVNDKLMEEFPIKESMPSTDINGIGITAFGPLEEIGGCFNGYHFEENENY